MFFLGILTPENQAAVDIVGSAAPGDRRYHALCHPPRSGTPPRRMSFAQKCTNIAYFKLAF